MKLKIGDKVKMTPKGFKFYSNIDIQFDMGSVARLMERKHFTITACQLFAIHGIGVVKKFNDEGDPYIRWEFSFDGISYHYEHYFDLKDVKRLSFLDRLIFNIRDLVC